MGGVLRSSDPEDRRIPPIFGEYLPPFSKKSHPHLSSLVRYSTHYSNPKIEDRGISSSFKTEYQRLKKRGSSIFGSDDRRWEVLRSSDRKDRRTPPIFEKPPTFEEDPPSSNNISRVRRNPLRLRRAPFFFDEPPHLRSSNPRIEKNNFRSSKWKIRSKIAIGTVVISSRQFARGSSKTLS